MERPKLNNNQNVEVQIQSQKIKIAEIVKSRCLFNFLITCV